MTGKVADGKKLNLSESHVVIITKEEELKTDTQGYPQFQHHNCIYYSIGQKPRETHWHEEQ